MENLKEHIAAILFDLDGTLMDTDNQSVARLRKCFSLLHFSHPQRMARRLVMSLENPVNGLITFMDFLGIDKPIMNFWQWIRLKQGKVKHSFHIIPGVVEMLNQLKDRYRLAVVTTRSQAEAEAFLEENHLQGIFELLVTRTSARRLKPRPEPVLFAAGQLNVPVDRCLMVGDTTSDIYSAKAAGAFSIGVLCGFGTREELEKAGAEMVLEHTADLDTLLSET